MKKSHLFGIVFALLAVSAESSASLVTFNLFDRLGGDWTGNASGPLETSAANLDLLSFTWTFDTDTPDSDSSSDWGFYDGAITGCSLIMGAYSFACGSGPNHIELGYEPFGNLGIERYIAEVTLADASGFSAITFHFETFFHGIERGSLLPNGDSLNMQPWSVGCDVGVLIQYTHQGQKNTGSSYCSGVETWTAVTDPVPLPPALWLFASGLLGLVGVNLRPAQERKPARQV